MSESKDEAEGDEAVPPVNEMDIQLLRTFQRLSSVGYSLLRIYKELGEGYSLEEIVAQVTGVK